MLSAAPLGFLALAILAYAVRLYRQARRLKDFKGPFGTAFSSLWMLDALLSKSSHLKLADACEKYGQS